MKLVVKNSPNQSTRLEGAVRIIVVHTPEGSYAGATATIMNPAAQVSYHRLYKKDGSEATQFVRWTNKAWHAKTYNSISDGLSVEGFARSFSLRDPGVKELAEGVAERLHARGLKPQWTTDPAKGGFCRHGDLQNDRTDPTPDLGEWRIFVAMVQDAYRKQTNPVPTKVAWPIPLPAWTWEWMAWHLQGRTAPRPKFAPRLIPMWAWRRLRALEDARRH